MIINLSQSNEIFHIYIIIKNKKIILEFFIFLNKNYNENSFEINSF